MYETGSAITSTGALTAYSGAKTGRSPLDKRVVKEEGSEKDVWWGPVNKPMSPQVSTILTVTPLWKMGERALRNGIQMRPFALHIRQSTPHLLSYRQVTCVLSPISDHSILGMEDQPRTGC